MTEAEFQVFKSIGFVLAFVLALGGQRLSPHRPMAGSWRPKSRLWALNAIVLGAVCAGCACTVSRWASDAGVGLLNQGAGSAFLAIPISVLGMDLVSYIWHRANHVAPYLSREARLLDTNYGTIFTLWDRLLRSYGENRSDVRVNTGLPGIDRSLGAMEILSLPARGVFRGNQCVSGSPGSSPWLRPNKTLQLTPNSRIQPIHGTLWQRALIPTSKKFLFSVSERMDFIRRSERSHESVDSCDSSDHWYFLHGKRGS
jgi:hypothetical protein